MADDDAVTRSPTAPGYFDFMITPKPAVFSFIKLIVDDLEGLAAFYKSVCGFEQLAGGRSVTRGGRSVDEIALGDPSGAPPFLTLLKYGGRSAQPHAETEIGMVTADIEAFVRRAVEAGGSVRMAPKGVVEGDARIKLAFLADPEGHVVEVIQHLGPVGGQP